MDYVDRHTQDSAGGEGTSVNRTGLRRDQRMGKDALTVEGAGAAELPEAGMAGANVP